jgi:streptogramin lyase
MWAVLLVGFGQAPALDYPLFLAVAPDGSVVVGDQDAPAVVRIGADGKSARIHAGSKSFRTPLHRPRGVALDAAGNAYVCDPATMDVYRIPNNGPPAGLTGRAIVELNKQPGVRGEFIQPEGVAVTADGVVYVSDLRLKTIFRIEPGDKTPKKVATVDAPHGMLLDDDGTLVVVSHGENHLVRVDPKTGAVTNILKGRLPGKIAPFPLSVAKLGAGDYLVTDNYNRCVWKVAKTGAVEVFFASEQLKKVTGVGVTKDGRIAIADPGSRCVWWLGPDKKLKPAGTP